MTSPPKINFKARHKARRFALQALYQWQLAQMNLVDIETQFLVQTEFANTDREYFLELLHGIPACLDKIDQAIQPYLDRPFKDVNPVEKALLRIAAYELLKRLDIPYRVIINESLELAKRFGGEDSHKFINGVLDPLARLSRNAEFSQKNE